jgi:hypothetical protein
MAKLGLEDLNKIQVLDDLYQSFLIWSRYELQVERSLDTQKFHDGYEAGLRSIKRIVTEKSIHKDFDSDFKELYDALNDDNFTNHNHYYRGMYEACLNFYYTYYRKD